MVMMRRGEDIPGIPGVLAVAASAMAALHLGHHLLSLRGNTLRIQDRFEQALQCLKLAAKVGEIVPVLLPEQTDVYQDLAATYIQLGDCENALAYGLKMIDKARTATQAAIYCRDLGHAFYWKQYYECSLEMYQRGVRLLASISHSESHLKLKASICFGMGCVYGNLGNVDLEVTCCRQGIEYLEQSLPRPHAPSEHVATKYQFLALALFQKGLLHESRDFFKRSIAILEAVEPRVRDLGKNYFGLGRAFSQDTTQQADKANRYYQQFISFLLVEPDQLHVQDFCDLGYAYCELGDWDRAQYYTNMAINVIEGRKRAYSPQILSRSFCTRARAFVEQGNVDNAIADLRKAAEIEKAHAPGISILPDIFYQLGCIYRTRGDLNYAIAYVQRAIAFYECHQACLRLKLAENYKLLGMLFNEQGRYFRAVECYHEAIILSAEYLPNYVDFELCRKFGVAVAALMRTRALLAQASDEELQSLLEDAVREGSSDNVVRLLFERASQERVRGDALYDLIEEGLENDAKADVLRLLLEQDPSIATYENEQRGCYLLFAACECRAPREFIEYLVELYPRAVDTCEDWTGETPLHQAWYLPLETFELLVGVCPWAIYRTTRDGQIPLHFACKRGAPLEVVRFLVSRNPQSVYRADNSGSLPLHKAVCCEKGAVRDVYDYLVDLFPNAVSFRHNWGHLPLHCACKGCNWDVTRSLIETCEDGVHVEDSLGCLPFHFACEWDIPFDLAMRFIEIHPNCVRHSHSRGWLPLHFACRHSRVSDEVFDLILRQYPEAARLTEQNAGWLPLHAACHPCEVFVRLTFVEVLVQANPLALLKKASDGMTPLRMAYSGFRADDAVRAYLFREQERVVQSHIDAIKSAASGMAGFDDLVANRIWSFIEDLWRPSDDDAK